jgi:hypothetical protein
MLIGMGTSLYQFMMMSPGRIYSHAQLSDFDDNCSTVEESGGHVIQRDARALQACRRERCVRSFNAEHLAWRTQ